MSVAVSNSCRGRFNKSSLLLSEKKFSEVNAIQLLQSNMQCPIQRILRITSLIISKLLLKSLLFLFLYMFSQRGNSYHAKLLITENHQCHRSHRKYCKVVAFLRNDIDNSYNYSPYHYIARRGLRLRSTKSAWQAEDDETTATSQRQIEVATIGWTWTKAWVPNRGQWIMTSNMFVDSSISINDVLFIYILFYCCLTGCYSEW